MRAVYPLMLVMLLSACNASSGVAPAPAAKVDSAAGASQARGAGSGASGNASAPTAHGSGEPASAAPAPIGAAAVGGAGGGASAPRDDAHGNWTPEAMLTSPRWTCREEDNVSKVCVSGKFSVQIFKQSCEQSMDGFSSVGDTTMRDKPSDSTGNVVATLTGYGLACERASSSEEGAAPFTGWSYVVLVPINESALCRTSRESCRFDRPLRLAPTERAPRGECHIRNGAFTSGCIAGWVRTSTLVN